MHIFSKGNLYIGEDVTNYTQVRIHLGKYLLEYFRKPESDGSQPATEESN